MRDLLPIIEFAAKAARTALAHVGAAIDCGMPAASAQRAQGSVEAFLGTGHGSYAVVDDLTDYEAGYQAGRDNEAAGHHPDTAPAGVSDGPEAPAPPAGLSWVDWATPAICDVLAEHRIDHDGRFFTCYGVGESEPHAACPDLQAWREHVAPPIAQRLETAALALDPAKAARESDQRIAFALGLFEQHRKPQ